MVDINGPLQTRGEKSTYSTYGRLISILLREGFYAKSPKIQTVWPHRQVQRYLSTTVSAIRPELASRRAEHSLPYSDVAKYIFDT